MVEDEFNEAGKQLDTQLGRTLELQALIDTQLKRATDAQRQLESQPN